MRFWLSVPFCIFCFTCFGQKVVRKIDMTRIPQQKVRTLIENQSDNQSALNISDLKSTYQNGQDITQYHIIESYYVVKESADKVWEAYNEASPAESWDGKMVSFGLLVSKNNTSVLYCNDDYFTGIDTGQVFFVNLKIMKGLYNLAVALEIINIDTVNRSITYSYIKGGKSRGEQTIYFMPTKKGYTRILHQTAFKSGRFFRDFYLYPFFHRRAINEFHRNMKKQLYAHVN